MKKWLKWGFFLSKRLYKKWMFILLIALIPLSVGALTLTSSESKGFVQIAYVNRAGELGEAILDNLDSGKGIIRYIVYDDVEQAKLDLQADRLDAIWVLPDHMEERIAAYVKQSTEEHYLVQVIRKEESLKTRLSLERLSSAMYPFLSRQLFLQCMRNDPDFDLSGLTDADIYKYFDDYFSAGELFEFAFPDGDATATETEQDYLTSPVRGLLSAVTVLAGLAAAMLFISDEKKGVFSYRRSSSRVMLSFVFQLTAILNVGLFAFVSVFLLGVNTFFWREVLIFLLFAVNTALFCTILQQLVPRITYFAPLTVLIGVMDLLICPIFFDYTVQRTPQFFFPNTYYINSVHSQDYLLYSLIYLAAASFALFLIYLYKRKRAS